MEDLANSTDGARTGEIRPELDGRRGTMDEDLIGGLGDSPDIKMVHANTDANMELINLDDRHYRQFLESFKPKYRQLAIFKDSKTTSTLHLDVSNCHPSVMPGFLFLTSERVSVGGERKLTTDIH